MSQRGALCQGQTWPSQVEEGFEWGQGGYDGSMILEEALEEEVGACSPCRSPGEGAGWFFWVARLCLKGPASQ